MKLKAYGNDADATSTVHAKAEPVMDSRMGTFGIVPIDAIKTLDRKKIAFVADSTLDETIEAIEMLFGQLQLCDTCEEPATRMAEVDREDDLDRPREHACPTCKFSRGAKNIRPTLTAEAIHRAKSLITMLQVRR